jgi:hypothetical protein
MQLHTAFDDGDEKIEFVHLTGAVKITIGPEHRPSGQYQYAERYITIEDDNGECFVIHVSTKAGNTCLVVEQGSN